MGFSGFGKLLHGLDDAAVEVVSLQAMTFVVSGDAGVLIAGHGVNDWVVDRSLSGDYTREEHP